MAGQPTSYTWPLATTPAPTPTAGGSGNFAAGLTFGQLWAWFLLCFPPSWVQSALGTGTATTALFSALVDVMTAPGDWLFPTGTASISQLQAQLRFSTMTGNALDHAALDFYGITLPRNPGESDSSYRARIMAGLFIDRITRPNIFAFLKTYTGQNPHLIDPNSPAATGAWTACTNIAGIAVVGGKSVYPSFDAEAASGGHCPPCFWGGPVSAPAGGGAGFDGLGFAFRYTEPNGGPTNRGYAYQVFIDTTYPAGFGAQGNEAVGYLQCGAGTNPPTAPSGGSIVTGSPSVYTNSPSTVAMTGGGFIGVGAVSVVGGKSIYAVTAGDPASAYFYSRGLTANDLATGKAQVLTATDKLRAAGFTFWMRCLPAEYLAAQGWTS